MLSKKIYIILVIIISTITLTGLVCADKLANTGGNNPNNTITIDDIEFNIPDGYHKNDSKSIQNQLNTTGNITFKVNQETLINSNQEEIRITVADYDDFDVDEKVLNRICQGLEEKKLMGYP